MTEFSMTVAKSQKPGLLCRLARDRSGNTLMLVGASLAPLLALIGGGIDMSRGYLSQSRLQQACDAGVLATRKRLGTSVVIDGQIPADAIDAGNRFFNLNYHDGMYGSTDRTFQMSLNDEYAVSGEATVQVPTTVMNIFGVDGIPLKVNCEANVSSSNTDVMMVLDVTGSMAWRNPGDTTSKIQALRSTVINFYNQLEATKGPTTRIRYGFVPYSTNVNVGYLLKSGWMVDEWEYNGRTPHNSGGGPTETDPKANVILSVLGGTKTAIPATWAKKCPRDSVSFKRLTKYQLTAEDKLAGITEKGELLANGTSYICEPDDGGFQVAGTTYTDYKYVYAKYDSKSGSSGSSGKWRYDHVPVDTTFIKGASDDALIVGGTTTVQMGGIAVDPQPMTVRFDGCIEERSTYEIDDYDNIDFTRALDLDIDRVPDPSDPDTQWRPVLDAISFIRSMTNRSGNFDPQQVISSSDFIQAGPLGLAACPPRARKLAEMDEASITSYVNSLNPRGSTYHDIGMIWGGRLLSPTGIFADENKDVDGIPTTRHLIFLTDGETAPLDLSYGTYGIEPLDRRRWSENSSRTLRSTVEKRFSAACNEVKKKNITVWVISFGTSMTTLLSDCAGPGHAYSAANAEQLDSAFSNIAKTIGELRITK